MTTRFEEAARALAADPPVAPPSLRQLEQRAQTLRRRRRTVPVLLGAVAVIAALAGVIASREGGTGSGVKPQHLKVVGPPPTTAAAPAGVARATSRPTGKAAVVIGGRLHIIDPASGRDTVLAALGQVSDPAWSPDGTWLSYATVPAGQPGVVRADGTGAHLVSSAPRYSTLAGPAAASWSPDNVLAFATTGGIVIAAPGGGAARLVAGGTISSGPLWSPDGTELAYTTDSPGAFDRLLLLPFAHGGDTPTGPPRAVPVTGPSDTGLILAGWHPNADFALLAWLDPMHSGSIAADGLPLVSIDLNDGRQHALTTTLTHPAWLSWAPDGKRVVVVAGSGRSVSTGKSLAICDAVNGGCQPLPTGSGTVAVDPAWSPGGANILYVGAIAAPNATTGDPAWLDSHKLAAVSTGGADVTSAVMKGVGFPAAASPAWLDGGAWFSVVSLGKLQLVDPTAGKVVTLATVTSPPDYYGYADWASVVAWPRCAAASCS